MDHQNFQWAVNVNNRNKKPKSTSNYHTTYVCLKIYCSFLKYFKLIFYTQLISV